MLPYLLNCWKIYLGLVTSCVSRGFWAVNLSPGLHLYTSHKHCLHRRLVLAQKTLVHVWLFSDVSSQLRLTAVDGLHSCYLELRLTPFNWKALSSFALNIKKKKRIGPSSKYVCICEDELVGLFCSAVGLRGQPAFRVLCQSLCLCHIRICE